jgi:hypothetical protein
LRAARGPRVERHTDPRAKGDQLVDSALLSRAHVRRSDDPDSTAAADDTRQRVAKMSDTRPDHKRTDQVDRLGTRELGSQLRADVRLSLSVDQQIALAQRSCRCDGKGERIAERGSGLDAEQDLRWDLQLRILRIALGEIAEQSVDATCLSVR